MSRDELHRPERKDWDAALHAQPALAREGWQYHSSDWLKDLLVLTAAGEMPVFHGEQLPDRPLHDRPIAWLFLHATRASGAPLTGEMAGPFVSRAAELVDVSGDTDDVEIRAAVCNVALCLAVLGGRSEAILAARQARLAVSGSPLDDGESIELLMTTSPSFVPPPLPTARLDAASLVLSASGESAIWITIALHLVAQRLNVSIRELIDACFDDYARELCNPPGRRKYGKEKTCWRVVTKPPRLEKLVILSGEDRPTRAALDLLWLPYSRMKRELEEMLRGEFPLKKVQKGRSKAHLRGLLANPETTLALTIENGATLLHPEAAESCRRRIETMDEWMKTLYPDDFQCQVRFEVEA